MIEERKWYDRNLSMLGLYYHLCTYGQNIVKPVMWLLLITFLGTIYWTFFYSFDIYPEKLAPVPFNETLTNNNLSDHLPKYSVFDTFDKKITNPDLLVKSLERTLQNIVSFNDEALIGDIAIRMASAIVLGAIAITIRRTIENQ